ncbi:MAG: hypothetical protein QM778_21605 [Myxococcales bacterium]
MMDAIHIVALGARTPVGLDAAGSAAAVRAGISRIVLHPFMADQLNENVKGAIDGAFDAGILGWERMAALAGFALAQVTAPIAAAKPGAVLPVLLAMPEERPGFSAHDERCITNKLLAAQADLGRPVDIRVSGRGHAGGLEAMVDAATRIRAGQHDVCIVGGVDSYFDFDTLDWLQEHRQLSTGESRAGFPPGEAAGFVALASARACRTLRLPSLGVLRSSGTAQESRLIKGDLASLGRGLADAIASALQGLRLPEQSPDVMYCDINGERYRSEEWGLAILRTPHAVRKLDFVAPVDCWGDVGAATGPLLCMLALRSWARGYAEGPRALVWAGSEAGLRAALVLEATDGR